MAALRTLGDSGLAVSPIALGSWRTFERMDRRDAERVLAHAVERGITFFDDARYDDETGHAPLPSGYSEVLFGELFRAVGAPRDRVLVSNKLWWEFWPREDGLSEIDGSLERMGFDFVDVLYASTLPDHLPVAEAVEQIASVLAQGRARSWAVVNWGAEALATATGEARRLGISGPCAAQLPYSLARIDWVESDAMQSALDDASASLVPSAALAGGALTGKYARGESGRLSSELDRPERVRALELGTAVARRARELGVDPASLAIAFTLLHPRTACTLIGATRPEHIDAALAAVELADTLSAEDRAFLRHLAST